LQENSARGEKRNSPPIGHAFVISSGRGVEEREMEITYCSGCGNRLSTRDFDRGLAHTRDRRPFCVRCLPIFATSPTPTIPVSTHVDTRMRARPN
jgi:hypothetical protein